MKHKILSIPIILTVFIAIIAYNPCPALAEEITTTVTPTPTIIAVDVTKPVITGAKNITTTLGKKINLLKNVKAIDDVDGDITKNIKVSKVDFNKLGTQKVTYTVQDKAGNIVTKIVKLIIRRQEKKCNKVRYVNVNKLIVRADYSVKSKKVKTLSYRQKVRMIATVKGITWIKVKLSSGKVGYVNSKYLSISRPASPSHVTHKSTTHKSQNHKKSSSSSSHKKSVDSIPHTEPHINDDGSHTGYGGGK